MKFRLNENIFEHLNKDDLDIFIEDLDPSIDGQEVLYEDDDYSKTPAEADKYRTDTEDVLGFELNGNLVQYLASSWPEFYHNAKKYSNLRDSIILFMQNEGLISENDLDSINFDDVDNFDLTNSSFDDEDSVDSSNIATLPKSGFTPLNVQSWEPAQDANKLDSSSSIDDLANLQVEDDDFDDEDEEILNNILNQ